ncbi:hypothetical protein HRI_001546200 [Hibiscus trionum]|uniref:Uncharacterized protein n=1 Tax=Hibiscus trionum TaxID=183268 RepID=A0A9W7LVI5_HIBTR|nr:hypothetical protein HRI_001546200 [Hibiscus trionum]
MNVLSYECSSGCESGWTSYLEQSFCLGNLSQKSNGFSEEHRKGRDKGKEEVVVVVNDDDDGDEEEVEEDDLSMISDASSGPPHFNIEDNSNLYSVLKVAALNENGCKSDRNKEHETQREEHQQDDTASSPLINFSKNNFGHSNKYKHGSMEESGFHYPQVVGQEK